MPGFGATICIANHLKAKSELSMNTNGKSRKHYKVHLPPRLSCNNIRTMASIHLKQLNIFSPPYTPRAEGKPIPTELKSEYDNLQRELGLEDDQTKGPLLIIDWQELMIEIKLYCKRG